jgi:hypothetical protein
MIVGSQSRLGKEPSITLNQLYIPSIHRMNTVQVGDG